MKRPNRTVAKIKSDYMNQYNAQMERKRRRKKRLIQRLIFASMVIVITFGVMATYHIKQRSLYSEKQKEFDELTEQLTVLEKEEKELLEEIDLLNDDEYILDIARTNYFLSKKGELIFQLEDEKERSY
ncbi:septum formation initiator family protein [Pseudogracilibacillus auburnensis]|uniref:Cell division protein DivIC n=1 Tax=Pseudogracilibacillus auburnensis TaxID=1494959 RepID=A0A2V3VYA9_9BACI|nr:septum formation initiator family protein [Pseudogracilibacillus auburnensis]PXW81559.1 cell division protein DivIC [Pseudogracilibacillus auburnensis]